MGCGREGWRGGERRTGRTHVLRACVRVWATSLPRSECPAPTVRAARAMGQPRARRRRARPNSIGSAGLGSGRAEGLARGHSRELGEARRSVG